MKGNTEVWDDWRGKVGLRERGLCICCGGSFVVIFV